MQNHIKLAHYYWEQNLRPEDTAIDATCGNGKDTLVLARIAHLGQVIGLDIQEQAIINTQKRLKKNLESEQLQRIQLFHQSHETFPAHIHNVKLIVYNLGYLPYGNKNFTTLTETTLTSLQAAMSILAVDGTISITCYPGHLEGAKEEKALLQFLTTIDLKNWLIHNHIWELNKPSLILLKKTN